MALLATQQIQQAGLVPALAAASGGGDTFEPGDHVFLHVKNADSGPHTVTIVTTATEFGQPVADLAVVVAAGTERLIGPLIDAEFNDPSAGVGSITYSAVTSVTVGVFSI
jgi:hypothetical protein